MCGCQEARCLSAAISSLCADANAYGYAYTGSTHPHPQIRRRSLRLYAYVRMREKMAHGQLSRSVSLCVDWMWREIVRTAIAPCSDSVRKIQSPHTYKSQNSNTPGIRSPWLVTRPSQTARCLCTPTSLSPNTCFQAGSLLQQNASYQSFTE